MGWVWSDELARTLRESPEFATHIPGAWMARPSAFATLDDETPVATVRRLLGLPVIETEEIQGTGASLPCSCGERSS